MDKGNLEGERQKTFTLEGLGPLSNPRIFRLYAMIFLGGMIYGWTLIATYGHYAIFVVTIITAIAVSRQLPDIQARLPPAARLDVLNIAGGWLVGVIGTLVDATLTSSFTQTLVTEALGFGAFSAALIYVSANYRTLGRRLRGRSSSETAS